MAHTDPTAVLNSIIQKSMDDAAHTGGDLPGNPPLARHAVPWTDTDNVAHPTWCPMCGGRLDLLDVPVLSSLSGPNWVKPA